MKSACQSCLVGVSTAAACCCSCTAVSPAGLLLSTAIDITIASDYVPGEEFKWMLLLLCR